MSEGLPICMRFGEAFSRAHHEAWCRSDLNQGEHFELHRLPLKVFGNWRARSKAAPEAPPRKLLYRRGGLSHTLSHLTKGERSVAPPRPATGSGAGSVKPINGRS